MQRVRLRVMAVLNSLAAHEGLEFGRLKASVEATDGNLGGHLSTLERAGYVRIDKDFVGKRPRTRIALTASGRRAFALHVAYLRELIDSALEPAP